VRTILAWKGNRDTLKKQFLEHCKGHREEYNARLKCHKDQVAARGVSAGIDSDIDSEDSRASWMNELEETETELAKEKKAVERCEKRFCQFGMALEWYMTSIRQ
jgi:hypothetical protein